MGKAVAHTTVFVINNQGFGYLTQTIIYHSVTQTLKQTVSVYNCIHKANDFCAHDVQTLKYIA
jgi:hypothetical protein